jgi:tRNA (guanine-N(7)-)-methyltransferase subunit TRM82
MLSPEVNAEQPKQDLEKAEAGQPPSKKRKVHVQDETANITKIVITPSQTHAVVVTAEDKSVRVFSLSQEGKLEHLSCRSVAVSSGQ